MEALGLTAEQQAELDQQQGEQHETRRLTVPALEEILYHPFPVLDHGFVRIVDYHGGDDSIVRAARVSYGRGTRRVSDDRGLIRYLMRHAHSTPLEMATCQLHVKLPMFVARQWIRHRTASVNEVSARYSILDSEFYVPDLDAVAAQSTTNRQGRGEAFAAGEAEAVRTLLRDEAARDYGHYDDLLNEAAPGVPRDPNRPMLARELARTILPVSAYTSWYWQISLHNLFHFLALRSDAHAQYEIRAYATVILDEIVRRWVPLAYEGFRDYRLDAASLSGPALSVVRRLLAGRRDDADALRKESGIAQREWRELMAVLELPENQPAS